MDLFPLYSCHLYWHYTSLLKKFDPMSTWTLKILVYQKNDKNKRKLWKCISKRLSLTYLPQYWSDGKIGYWQTCLSCCTCQMVAVHIRFFRCCHKMQPGYRRNTTVFQHMQNHILLHWQHNLCQYLWCSSTRTRGPESWQRRRHCELLGWWRRVNLYWFSP